MRFRKLRIAWSVAWGVVAVLLCVLWCTSYFWGSYIVNDVDDSKVRFRSQMTWISSSGGSIVIFSMPGIMWPHRYGWHGGTYKFDTKQTRFWYYWESSPTGYELHISHLLLALAVGSIGALPWASHLRFSLRTLFIATTLVAVVLGLAVSLIQG